jgi:hypothetical protein
MFRFSPTITFEEWRKAFILACQKLGVKAIPAHWSLTDSWQTGVNPERLADDAKFWDVIHHR